jgi:hypothetical protein
MIVYSGADPGQLGRCRRGPPTEAAERLLPGRRAAGKLGADPAGMLYEHAAGPTGADGAPGMFCCGLCAVSIDGSTTCRTARRTLSISADRRTSRGRRISAGPVISPKPGLKSPIGIPSDTWPGRRQQETARSVPAGSLSAAGGGRLAAQMGRDQGRGWTTSCRTTPAGR